MKRIVSTTARVTTTSGKRIFATPFPAPRASSSTYNSSTCPSCRQLTTSCTPIILPRFTFSQSPIPSSSSRPLYTPPISSYTSSRRRSASSSSSFTPTPSPTFSAGPLVRALLTRLEEWVSSERVKRRLETYGFEHDTAVSTLQSWSDDISPKLRSILKAIHNASTSRKTTNQSPSASSSSTTTVDAPVPSFEALAEFGFDVASLRLAHDAGDPGQVFEAALHRHHLIFCLTHPTTPPHLVPHLQALLRATDVSRLASTGYTSARSMSRHFHLHVGPTNSGKTYSALKALSSARTGVYAGPLRLLAHEVWERVNLGTVGGMEGVGRQCNLLTGEERRVVHPDAGLLSCTVEMVPPTAAEGEPWDVVVIDEIQMMGDSHRGGAWTNAVMGVSANEIHLCGDDTAVDLLRSMVASFGTDTLTVHRYERLTPLRVADESLDGDWSKVAAGDCVVTFSRTGIFAVKRLVEKQAGKKCAVVYGALPPETRAEQAREFNDENGRAEVLVASDAVGMGLNLKINRIIFESMTKFDGRKEVPLALTQIKQIAGRAGRFGMQRTSTPSPPRPESTTTAPESTTTGPSPSLSGPDDVPLSGGVVTTFHSDDLSTLRHSLPKPLPPLTRAVMDVPYSALSELSALLHPSTPFHELQDHMAALVRLPSSTSLGSSDQKTAQMRVVEPFRDALGLAEVDLLSYAPVNRRDERVMGVFTSIVANFADFGIVKIQDVLESSASRMLDTLEMVEDTLASLPPLDLENQNNKGPRTPQMLISSLPLLESLHKSLVLYIWLSFRLDIGFPDRADAVSLKERTERVLEACLERLPGPRDKGKRRDKEKERDGRGRKADGKGGKGQGEEVEKGGKSGKGKKPIEWMDRDEVKRRSAGKQWGRVTLVE